MDCVVTSEEAMATGSGSGDAGTAREVIRDGAVSGLVAGVGMGVLLSVGTGLLPLIGALYGRESFAWGWVAHLGNSVFFGLVFVAIVSRPFVRASHPPLGTYLGYGIVYGAMLEVVTGGILFPLWLRAAEAPELSFPFFPIPGAVEQFSPAIVLGLAHLVYGALLGLTYAYLSGSDRSGEDRRPAGTP